MSQISREDMLRELELLPVWQLRQPLPMAFIAETPAADEREIIVNEQEVKPQESVVDALPLMAVAPTESQSPEDEAFVCDTLMTVELSADSAPAPSILVGVLPQAEVVEHAQSAPVSFLEQALPLRLLLSDDSTYAFLIAPYVNAAEMQEVEVLLKNMIRAMQVSCRVDVTDSVDKIFAMHIPKLIISFGAEPANHLLGSTYAIDEWRNMQQQSPLRYRQTALIVTHHPAHLLENTADKVFAWRDLCMAMKLQQRL